MATTSADDEHHLVRLVRPGQRALDGDGNVVGVLFSAFELREAAAGRPKETYLSSSCLEVAAVGRMPALSAIKKCMTTRGFKLKNTLLTIGRVANIKETFGSHRIRITCEPKSWNAAYSAVRKLPVEYRASAERLARETWADWCPIDSVP